MQSSAINQGSGAETNRSDLNVSLASDAKQAEVMLSQDDNKDVDALKKELEKQNKVQQMKVAQ